MFYANFCYIILNLFTDISHDAPVVPPDDVPVGDLIDISSDKMPEPAHEKPVIQEEVTDSNIQKIQYYSLLFVCTKQ